MARAWPNLRSARSWISPYFSYECLNPVAEWAPLAAGERIEATGGTVLSIRPACGGTLENRLVPLFPSVSHLAFTHCKKQIGYPAFDETSKAERVQGGKARMG